MNAMVVHVWRNLTSFIVDEEPICTVILAKFLAAPWVGGVAKETVLGTSVPMPREDLPVGGTLESFCSSPLDYTPTQSGIGFLNPETRLSLILFPCVPHLA